jgi:hypothetical protein
MARASHEVKVRLTAEDRASKEFAKAEKSARGFSGFLKKNFVAAAALATAAAYSLSKAIGAWGSAMLEAEKGNKAIQVALDKTGDATKANIQAFKDQANAIQESTRFTADSITQTQAFLKQLGVSTDQLGLATQATIDLSESFGLTLESAARNVGKTVGGFAGELGELIPELKELDAEALKAGAGIQLLADKFSGAAADAADTLEVRLKQLNNELSDLGKALAEGAAGTGDFKDAVKEAGDAARGFNDEARLVGAGFRELIGGTLQKFADAGTLIGKVYSSVTAPAIIKVADASEAMRKKIEASSQAMRDHNAAAKFQADVMEKLKESYGGAATALEVLLGLAERNSRVNAEAAERQKKVTAALKEMGVSLETDVNAKIEANNKLLEDATMLYDQRVLQNGELIVSHGDLARIEEEVAARNRELTASLTAQTDALSDTADGFDDASSSANRYGQSLDGLPDKIKRVSDAEQAAAAARSFGGTQTGGSLLFPDSAIANTAIRNGQLVDVRMQRFGR